MVLVAWWLTIGLIALVLLLQATPDFGSTRLARTTRFLLDNKEKVNGVLLGFLAVFGAAKSFVGEPWLWATIKDILTSFQRDVFDSLGDGELSADHRVTLYKYQRFCLWPRGRGPIYWPWGKGTHPWSGWLVPMVRAGPRSPATTVFLVGDGKGYEGVCGAAFCEQHGVVEKNGSDLPNITNQSVDVEIAEYAQKTFVSPEMVKRRLLRKRPCARYFLALRVEVQSEHWGVVMIDSRSASLNQPQKTFHRFEQINDILDHLLRRA